MPRLPSALGLGGAKRTGGTGGHTATHCTLVLVVPQIADAEKPTEQGATSCRRCSRSRGSRVQILNVCFHGVKPYRAKIRAAHILVAPTPRSPGI
eukprot:scaffold17141_cov146-Isochrysis_galbana.AAC.1